MPPKLSIVVPCFNESKNIPFILDRFEKCLLKNDFEVICVNNGSADDSKSVFETELAARNNPKIKIVDVPVNQGYGFGILAGLDAATGDFLSWTHADCQTDPMDLERSFETISAAENPEKTFLKGNRVGRGFGDWFFTLGMSILATVVLRTKLFDVNAQPKMFSRDFFAKVRENAPPDFSLDLYFLYLASKHDLKLIEIPVLFLDRKFGESNWNFSFSSKISTIWRTVKYIFALPNLIAKKS